MNTFIILQVFNWVDQMLHDKSCMHLHGKSTQQWLFLPQVQIKVPHQHHSYRENWSRHAHWETNCFRWQTIPCPTSGNISGDQKAEVEDGLVGKEILRTPEHICPMVNSDDKIEFVTQAPKLAINEQTAVRVGQHFLSLLKSRQTKKPV